MESGRHAMEKTEVRQSRDQIGGFTKGLQVIEAFTQDKPRLTIAELSRQTGLERATARRYLLTLVKGGYAEFDGKFFALTSRVLRLGYAYLAATPLPRIVQPYLERISQRTEESSSACVLEDAEIVYIARSQQRRVMSIGLQVGSRLPAYCTSMGRVLLAALPDEAVEETLSKAERPKVTPSTLTEIKALVDEIASVRERGFSIVDQELELGLRSIAVPVRDARGDIVASMNVGAQAARASLADLTEKFLPALLEAQDAMRRLIA
jgi:IclR family pca regulon transcriptional regulator